VFLYFKIFLNNKFNDFGGLWVAEGDVGGFIPQSNVILNFVWFLFIQHPLSPLLVFFPNQALSPEYIVYKLGIRLVKMMCLMWNIEHECY
jgi:hypothetical protein